MHPLFIWLFVFSPSAVTSDTKAILCRVKKANILLSGSCCDGEGNRIIFCLSPSHSSAPLSSLYDHIQGERGGTWLNKLPTNGPVELWEFMGIAVGTGPFAGPLPAWLIEGRSGVLQLLSTPSRTRPQRKICLFVWNRTE